MSGSSRSGRRVKANRPSTISSRLTTVASTGRLMERSEISMRSARFAAVCTRGLAACARVDDPGAVLQLDDALDHDAVARLHAIQHLDPARTARADLHRHQLDL